MPTKKTATKSTTILPADAALYYCSLKPPRPKLLNLDIVGERAELIVRNAKKWAAGTVLHYYFFDKKIDGAEVEFTDGRREFRSWVGNDAQRTQVRKAFRIWAQTGIGLKFKEVTTRKQAEVRIGFMQGDGSWSYIGRDILEVSPDDADPRTMNFGWDIATSDTHNGIDTALHEIGHTLGFPHEHQNPFAGIEWNADAVYAALAAAPNYWDKETVDRNIIDKISAQEVTGSDWDPNSIMHYPFERGLILKPEKYATTDLYPAGGLSAQDIEYALQFYPAKNAAKDIRMKEATPYAIDAANSAQQNFIYKPMQTKKRTLATTGQLDTVLVVHEKKPGGESRFVDGDDNSGTGKDAGITATFSKDKTYSIKVKVYYKKPSEKATLMIS